MTNGGPWDREPEPPPQRPSPSPNRRRLAFLLGGLAAGAALVAALAWAFPEARFDRDGWGDLGYTVGFLALLTAGLWRLRGLRLGHAVQMVAAWVGVIAVLALGYAYRDELKDVPHRLRVAASGGDPVAVGEREMAVPQSQGGGFVLVGRVNGQRVRFIVDTGADEVVLSPEDARRVGVDTDGLVYDRLSQTANGIGRGARHVAASVEVGPVRADDFEVVVNQAPMGASLLGMTFLRRFESFEVRGGRLILRWREGT